MLGQLINKQYTYEAILCDSRKNELTVLNYTDLTYSPKFKQYSELEIEIPYYQSGHTKIKDKNFDLTKGLYLIKLNIKDGDDIVKSEFFFIESPSKNSSDGIIKKSLHCYSYEYLIFNKKKLRGYSQTRKLYDPINDYDFNDTTKGGILNLLLKNFYNTWSIGYINPVFLNVYHTFDFSDSTYTDVIQELQKGYNCTILFDNINQTINIYTNEELGINTGLVLSDENYIKSISNEDKFDQIITRLTLVGKDNIGIHKYNPTGLGYVENYDWLISNGFFSDNLKTAWLNYKNLIASKKGQFESYITQLEGYETDLLLKQNQLSALNIEKSQIEDALDVEKNTYTSNTSTYDSIYSDLQLKESEIKNKQNEINSIKSNINSVNSNIMTLQNSLSYTNNFTQAQLEELVKFIFEETINMSQVSDSKQLYTYSLAYIEKISQVPITFNIDSVDIFSSQEGQLDWNKIKIADYINIDSPELGFNYYPIRLVGFNHNPISNSLSMTFSNTDKIESDILYLNDIFKLSNKVATEVEVKKYEYERYSNDRDRVIYTDSVITNTIQAGNNFINRRGFIGDDIGSYGALQIKNDKIIFSNSNPLWETYYTLLSANGLYLETDNKKSRCIISPSTGFQLDVWNPALNGWRNAIYLGLDNSNKPSLFIDNGYISLTRIVDNTEVNRIYLDPEVGIKIQAKNGVNWEDRFFVNTDGNLIAKQLRTSSDTNNYITLREQYIDFWNSNLKKIQMGFADWGGGVFVPTMIFGAGDENGLNRASFVKEGNIFSINYSTSNGYFINSIEFINNNTQYTAGAIKFVGVLEFANAAIRNFNYSYSKSESDDRYYIRSEVNSAIASAISDHELNYHS